MIKRGTWIVFLLLLVMSVPAIAANLDVEKSRLEAVKRQLQIDKKNNEIANSQLTQLKTNREAWIDYYSTHPLSQSTIKHVSLDTLAATTALKGLDIAINSAQDVVANTKESLTQLRKEKQRLVLLGQSKDPESPQKILEIEQQIAIQEAILNLENERINVLSSTRMVAVERLSFLTEWSGKLNRIFQKHEQKTQMEQSAAQINALQQSLQKWLDKVAALNEKFSSLTVEEGEQNGKIERLQLDLIEASERVEMTRMKIYLLRLHNSIQSIRAPSRKVYSVTSLNTLDKQAKKIVFQLNEAEAFIVSKSDYIDSKIAEYKTHLDKDELSHFTKILSTVQQDYLSMLNEIKQLLTQTNDIQNHMKSLLRDEISNRQMLPGFDVENWAMLGRNILEIPGLIMHSVSTSTKQIRQGFAEIPGWKIYVLAFAGLVFLTFWYLLREYLARASSAIIDKRSRFTTNLVYIAVEVLRRDLFAVFVLLSLVAVTIVTGAHTRLFMYLIMVYLIFKTLITIARLSLLETVADISGDDVKLYKKLKGALIFGFVLSAILTITHNLPVHYEIKGLSNRVFMLFILIMGWLLFKGRKIIPELFDANLPVRRRYVYHTLRIFNVLLPLALISNAVIGLLGYVEMAWLISKYQVIFLMTIVAYLITRGLFIDLIDYVSELFIRYIKNGWMWTEVFLRPLDKIIRVVLFFATLILLVHLYDLDKDVAFVTFWSDLLHKPLLEIGGNVISLIVILELVIVFMVLYWISRWSREFSFRLLYAKARDVGVRHSLSVFTQYLVVVIGVIIGLKLLGLDLTGFAVVAAAFAAGLGFGLRDMINNFFSGILLLVERPFRTGDIVAIGEYEGRVIHTGMRSITVRTWDHMEVIVPNSDLFSKPFVNWTHQDNLVRTVIRLNVNRSDDPNRIQALILEVLKSMEGVVDNPESEVFMKEVSESLIEMEVRYYITISPTSTRAKARSDVLFAIWECFKVNGIKPPLEQYDLRLHNI